MADKLPWELRFEAQRRIVSVSEPQRIVALPVFTPPTPEQIEEINRECVQAIPYNGGCSCDKCLGRPFRLLEDQANAVFVFKQTGRGFWNIEVGGGKTGACMLVASLAYQRNPSSKILLLIPPSVYDQFCLRDLPWGRAHLSLAVPFYGLQGSPQRRKTLAGMKRPGCYIMPYSLLSTTDTIELLRLIDADLIVADEGQNLMGEDSAKAKRFWSFVQTKKPKGVVMSGTLTRETPMEYRKLITLGLDVNSPLPRTKLDAVRWSAMLRSGAPEPDEFQDEVQDSIRPLQKWAREAFPEERFPWSTEGLRRAYRHRMHTAPGFYVSKDVKIGTSLEIANTPASTNHPKWDEIQKLMEDLRQAWLSPQGEVLQFGLEQHSMLRELSAGFYHRRYWDEEHPLVNEAKACFGARQVYLRRLKEFFNSTQKPREGMDTPMLVGEYHHRHGAISGWEDLYELWSFWKELDVEGLPERLSEPVLICDYKIQHALNWAKKTKPGAIIWVLHTAMLRWITKALADAGLPVVAKDRGDDWGLGDGTENMIVVAKRKAHGVGKNLQHYQRQLIVEWPRSATAVEQLLGRTHRTGQKADRLVVETCLTTDFDHEQLSAVLRDTTYDAETMSRRRRLLVADMNPQPKVYPPEYLRARGFNVKG